MAQVHLCWRCSTQQEVDHDADVETCACIALIAACLLESHRDSTSPGQLCVRPSDSEGAAILTCELISFANVPSGEPTHKLQPT